MTFGASQNYHLWRFSVVVEGLTEEMADQVGNDGEVAVDDNKSMEIMVTRKVV